MPGYSARIGLTVYIVADANAWVLRSAQDDNSFGELFGALLAGVRDPRINRFSSGEAFAGAVPVLDRSLA
jgi:hypothetical protein